MGPNETSKLLHSKGNHKQDKKTTLRMGGNICKWINRQRINLQNIQAVHAAQYQNNKQPNSKMGKGLEQTFLKIRHTNGQQAHEKTLIIREMQIKTTLRYHLTPIEIATYQKNNK